MTPVIASVLSDPVACAQPTPASVTVTVGPAVTAPVAVQPVRAPPVVIVGDDTAKLELNLTTTLPPADSVSCGELGWNPTVQVEPTAPPVCGTPANETLVGAVAAKMRMSLAGEAGVVSLAVATVKPAAIWLPAIGLPMPAMVSCAGVLAARAQVLVNEIVTVCPETVAVVGHVPVKPPVSATVAGDDGIVNAFGNTTVMVLLPPVLLKAPRVVGVKPTVHGTTEPAVSSGAVNDTPVTTPAVITTGETGEPGTPSTLVATVKPAAGLDPAAGLVTPAIVTVAGVLPASAHDVPVRSMVTVCPLTTPVVGHVPVKPLGSVTVAGLAGSTNPAGNVTVMVDGLANAPAAVGVNPTVQVDATPALCGDPANVTPVI